MKKIIKHLLLSILFIITAVCCFSLLGCGNDTPDGGTENSGSNNTPGDNSGSENFVDYTLKSFVYSVTGSGDYYIDVNNMSATDHATYDAVILMYGKHVKISSDSIQFVDGTVLSAYGATKYGLNGETVTLQNPALASTFNYVKLSNGVFSLGISQSIAGSTVTYSFDYYSQNVTEPSYKVSFDSMGGESVPSQNVNKGGQAQKPQNPYKSGYTFGGWYTDSACTDSFDFSSQVFGNLTLYAKWVPENKNYTDYSLNSFVYSVTGLGEYYIDLNDMSATDHATYDAVILMYGKHVNISSDDIRFVDGTVLSSYGTVNYISDGEKVTLLNPVLASSFNYVRLSNGVFSFGISQITGGSAVTYSFDYYAPNATGPSYKVSFDSTGGESVFTQTVKRGGQAKKPQDPNMHGYTFGGWYTDSDCTDYYDFSSRVLADLTLYAKWTPNRNKIDFQTYGGTSIREQTVYSGERVTIPASPKKAGYNFDGWYADSNFAEAWDFDTAVLENVTLHAKYSPIVYTISFNGLGGFCDTSVKEVTYNAEVGVLPVPVREDFTFDGWYDRENGGNAYTSSTVYNVAGDIELYPKWLTTITLNIDGTGGVEKSQISTAYKWKQSQIESIPSAYSTESGTTFTGWYTQPAAEGKYYDNSSNFDFEEPITLYASWRIRVNYNTEGGSSVSSSYVTKGKSFVPQTTSRTGYTFAGWYDGDGNKVDETTVINNGSEVELTASWTANEITFKFNPQGGSYVSDREYTYDSPLGELPVVEKQGNVFGGWFTATAGKGTQYDENTVCKNSYTITLYAKWTANVVFEYEGATSGNEQEKQEFIYNSSINISLPEPYKNGWSFEGWFSEREGNGTQLKNTCMVSPTATVWTLDGDTHFYAYWVKGTDKRYLSYTESSSVTVKGLIDASITELEIPAIINLKPVRVISGNAFRNTGLTSVVVPDTVQTIEAGAFMGCALTEITLPFVGMSRTSGGYTGVFGIIFGYKEVSGSTTTVEGAIKQYGYESGIYKYCWYFIPQTLEKVTITDTTSIPEKAFINCTMIKEINLNGRIATAGANAFNGCTELETLTGIESLVNVKNYAFNDCGKLMNFPESPLKTVGENAFYNCVNLTEVTFSEELTSIGRQAFKNTSITEIEITSGIQIIKYNAFANTGLTSVVIPDTVQTIEAGAFYGCAITEITLPFVGMSRTSSGYTGVFGIIFGYNEASTSTEKVEGAVKQYEYSSGTYRYCWYFIPAMLENVTITDTTSIPEKAFINCTMIKEINILGDITAIGANSFGCANLEVLRLSGELTGTVNSATFAGLSKDVLIIVPDEFAEYYREVFAGYTVINKSEEQ